MKHVVFDCDGTLVDTSTREFSLFPGIKELLTEMAREHQLYVWTARDRFSTLRILEKNGIHHLFEGLCTISDAPAKPHIGGLIALLGGKSKSTICMIGDSGNDMLGAKNFGIMSIGATWNAEASADFLLSFGADFIATHPSECSKLIQLNLKGENHV